VTADTEHAALQDALREIAVIDQQLRALGDMATLRRFGEAEAGASFAALLGHTLFTAAEARTVDQLSRMPGGIRLVRTFLSCSGVPRVSDVERMPERCERPSAAPTPPASVPEPARTRTPEVHR
jgi:hypothetical protein